MKRGPDPAKGEKDRFVDPYPRTPQNTTRQRVWCAREGGYREVRVGNPNRNEPMVHSTPKTVRRRRQRRKAAKTARWEAAVWAQRGVLHALEEGPPRPVWRPTPAQEKAIAAIPTRWIKVAYEDAFDPDKAGWVGASAAVARACHALTVWDSRTSDRILRRVGPLMFAPPWVEEVLFRVRHALQEETSKEEGYWWRSTYGVQYVPGQPYNAQASAAFLLMACQDEVVRGSVHFLARTAGEAHVAVLLRQLARTNKWFHAERVFHGVVGHSESEPDYRLNRQQSEGEWEISAWRAEELDRVP